MDKKSLLDWITIFIQSKDAYVGDLVNIKKATEFDLIAIYNNKEENIIVLPQIKNFDEFYEKLKKDVMIIIVVPNTKENFEIILENWKRLIDFDKLTIYFVNPDSQTETKWVIKPHMHNKISDDRSLKTGLETMFKSVQEVI